MEDISLTETESRYYADLFLCCDVEKSGKIPMLKATELYRSANLSNDVIREITSLSGIPQTALHISRSQFYSCLKLIAAYQASVPLREELIAATVSLPLPRFSWKESPTSTARIVGDVLMSSSTSVMNNMQQTNGINSDQRRNVADWRESGSPDLIQLAAGEASNAMLSLGSGSRRNSSTLQHNTQPYQHDAAANSDVPSTDSEVEQNESSGGLSGGGGIGVTGGIRESRRHRGGGDGLGGGSPEAWSTNSDSPTPTNSVAERPWDTLWHGLLGDEHRQLLGTEEESSDRHSSDDDNDTDLDTVYQITPEQREYYFKQFKAVQHDPNGLLSGHIARVFFEKSRIPVEELRHIWQLCDVTRDGALSLAEFTAAMHLVVLRRNNIPLPAVLPACLHPNVLKHSTSLMVTHNQQQNTEPPEADLLHLNDDDDEDNTDNTIIGMAANTKLRSSCAIAPPTNTSAIANEKNAMNMSALSLSSQASTNSRQGITTSTGVTGLSPQPPPVKNRSISNSPKVEQNSPVPVLPVFVKSKERTVWDDPSSQWTKFVESPTSNVSSPGPKPANFDMQRTAQAVVSDPQILHPVPLRVTPVGPSDITALEEHRKSENLSFELESVDSKQQIVIHAVPQSNSIITGVATIGTSTSSATVISNPINTGHHRDSLQSSDLRAIQRPQAKKLLAKNIGALPPPPQREPSIGGVAGTVCLEADTITQISGGAPPSLPSIPLQTVICNSGNQNNLASINKKDPPPLPPPRPHRHGRSSSLDLNKFKINAPSSSQQPEITAQASFDMQTTGFADFTHFPDGTKTNEQIVGPYDAAENQAPSSLPPPKFSLQSNQRVSAFEVYRKPNTPRNSQSPESTQLPSVAAAAASVVAPPYNVPSSSLATTAAMLNAETFEKRVTAISETLRHVSFRKDNNMAEILRHLREQNTLLLRLCNDLSDELLTVLQRKEEMRLKIVDALVVANGPPLPLQPPSTAPRTSSSISAPVTANITGGSGSSGVHSNV